MTEPQFEPRKVNRDATPIGSTSPAAQRPLLGSLVIQISLDDFM
ncbi:hypothetical protein [Arthrobacter sp. efr-133-TYG-118]|nr:hypothetical protein [Arthrobacter sp. efr-133-TYG-118]